MSDQVFEDRSAAGRALVPLLREYADQEDTSVVGLPRGGIPVAYAAATALGLPLDVLVVRKIGAPGQPEFALGAIAAGVVVENPEYARFAAADPAGGDAVVARERRELERRELAYRGGEPAFDPAGKTVILVDDGAATGASMRAAVRAMRRLRARKIIVALPTASAEACADLEREADRVLCVQTPRMFRAVGEWYESFDQVSDREVTDLLARARVG